MIMEQTAPQPAGKACQDIAAQASAESGEDGLPWLVPFPLSDDATGEQLEALLAWLK